VRVFLSFQRPRRIKPVFCFRFSSFPFDRALPPFCATSVCSPALGSCQFLKRVSARPDPSAIKRAFPPPPRTPPRFLAIRASLFEACADRLVPCEGKRSKTLVESGFLLTPWMCPSPAGLSAPHGPPHTTKAGGLHSNFLRDGAALPLLFRLPFVS